MKCKHNHFKLEYRIKNVCVIGGDVPFTEVISTMIIISIKKKTWISSKTSVQRTQLITCSSIGLVDFYADNFLVNKLADIMSATWASCDWISSKNFFLDIYPAVYWSEFVAHFLLGQYRLEFFFSFFTEIAINSTDNRSLFLLVFHEKDSLCFAQLASQVM